MLLAACFWGEGEPLAPHGKAQPFVAKREKAFPSFFPQAPFFPSALLSGEESGTRGSFPPKGKRSVHDSLIY